MPTGIAKHRLTYSTCATFVLLGFLVKNSAAVMPGLFFPGPQLSREAVRRPWHGLYYYPPWGRPMPLVVPPNSTMHTEYSWGVAMNEMRPVYHQFSRGYPGTVIGGSSLQAPPYYPARTQQMGVYPIRAPW